MRSNASHAASIDSVGMSVHSQSGGDPGSDAKTDVAQLAELLDHSIYLLCARSLRIEYRFRVVEDDECILRGQEWSEGI